MVCTQPNGAIVSAANAATQQLRFCESLTCGGWRIRMASSSPPGPAQPSLPPPLSTIDTRPIPGRPLSLEEESATQIQMPSEQCITRGMHCLPYTSQFSIGWVRMEAACRSFV